MFRLSRYLRRFALVGSVAAGFAVVAVTKNVFETQLNGIAFASDVGKKMCAFASEGKLGEMKEFLRTAEKQGYANIRHPNGWTPLMIAAVRGDLEMVKWLLSQGSHVDAEDKYESNALLAYKVRATEFPSIIDPQSRTFGFTALFYAVLSGNKEVVRTLLEAGADPHHQDSKGRRPVNMVQYLSISQQKDILQVFQDELRKIEEQRKKREREQRRQFPLEKRLMEKIVGQVAPILSVASAIRRKENGWHDSDHPLVFLFLGSSGIGKTELAKQVAEYLHGKNKDAFVRIDMSEYQTQHEVAKFIGSPPGYVGHNDGGQLTKKLTQHPDAVVLLDEVEKAHPDCLTIMLQVFDEGRLTDGKGKTVECKNAIFVMTSNLAQTEIADQALRMRKEGKGEDPFSDDFRLEVVQPILKRAFRRDEFLGRINEILYFLPFTDDELKELARRELSKCAARASERHSMELSWAPEVLDLVIKGYNVRFGARSIQHEVDRKVVSKLAASHEFDQIEQGSKVHLYVDPHSREVQLKVDNSNVAKGGSTTTTTTPAGGGGVTGAVKSALGKLYK